MADEPWIWSYRQTIPSRSGAGQPVVEAILDRLKQHAWIEHDVFGVHLALEEALVNAIKHGNGLDEHKQVTVDCKMSSERLWIRIADEGSGFVPDDIPDPTTPENLDHTGGRGIMLMRSFMSRVEYNAEGNCVVMEKQRQTTL